MVLVMSSNADAEGLVVPIPTFFPVPGIIEISVAEASVPPEGFTTL